jgi:glutathione S-transferase
MILIGQYDSPFVRRVGIALKLYDLPFEHRPWSTFGDADKIRRYNPLTRVPTLVLDDGEVLIESQIILDYLDGLVPADRAMFPRREPARHRALKIAALATGLGDKAVSLFYEKRLHREVSDVWIARCRGQISAGLSVLEAERAGQAQDYWFGDRMGHADVAIVTVLRFIAEAIPDIVAVSDFPSLGAYAARIEAQPVFQEISQRFIPPS